jgi:hypothetical protein
MAALLSVGTLLFFGCSETENAMDCLEICNRYQTCFNADYDTAACQDRCRDNANAESEENNRTAMCATCVDDKSCASSTFNCFDECAGIVP